MTEDLSLSLPPFFPIKDFSDFFIKLFLCIALVTVILLLFSLLRQARERQTHTHTHTHTHTNTPHTHIHTHTHTHTHRANENWAYPGWSKHKGVEQIDRRRTSTPLRHKAAGR